MAFARRSCRSPLNLYCSACHMRSRSGSAKNKNIFADKNGELGLSKTAYHFIGGVADSADAICAITNPSVNSFFPNAPPTLSGANPPPNTITYAGNNRTYMIRIFWLL